MSALAGSGSNDRCVGMTIESESIPLDIYVMFDQSGSMCNCLDPGAAQICPNPSCSETRLDAVRNATEQFLLDPESAGIGVGLGRFGNQPIGRASCDAGAYSAPVVSVGTLPEHAPTLMQALNGFEPIGENPPAPPFVAPARTLASGAPHIRADAWSCSC